MKSNRVLNKIKVSSILLSVICLSGCGFHLRSSHSWPIQLSKIAYLNQNVPSQMNYSILSFLKSMHIVLVKKYHLQLLASNYQANESLPTSQNSAIPSAITYSLSMTFAVKNNDKVCIPAFTLSSVYSQLESSQTVVTQATNPDIQARLLQDVIEQLYERLTSANVKRLLTKPQCMVADKKGSL